MTARLPNVPRWWLALCLAPPALELVALAVVVVVLR